MDLPSSTAPGFASPGGFLAATAALLEALPWGVLVLDEQGVIQQLNRQAAAWCGVGAGTLVGQPLAASSLPPTLRAALRQLRPEAPPREVWLPSTRQWLGLRATPDPAGSQWIFWDNITARKQAEAAQQRSSQLLLDMEAVAHTGSYEADLLSGSFYFSDGLYQLFGEAPQAFEVTLDVIDARSHPADVAPVRRVLDEAVRARQPYTYRRRIRRADGAWRTLEAHGEVHCDATGRPVQLRGLVQDVTERVQAEQAQREGHELLRRTIDSSLDLVQVFEAVRDEQGTVVDFAWILNNEAAERVYGDVVGQRLCERNPGVVKAGIFDTFRQVLETGVPDQREHHYAHEQFDGWFYQSTVKQGDGVTTTAHDISARKRLEQELRESQALLQDIIDAPNIGLAVYRAVRNEAGDVVDFTHEYINRASREMLGEDFTGRLFTDHGENGRSQLAQLREVLATGRRNSYLRETDFRGRRVWFAISNTPLDADRLVHTWEDVTERQRAEAEIIHLKEELAQQATDKYHALFQRLNQGFCVLEILFDAAGQQAVGFNPLEVNPRFAQESGMAAYATGDTLRELVPALDDVWLAAYGQVVRTGEAQRLERYEPQVSRWFEVHAFRIGPPAAHQVAVLFSDITARKQAEQHQQYVVRLADALRPLADPLAIQREALAVLRAHLGGTRTLYAEALDEEGTMYISTEDRDPGLVPMEGLAMRFQDFTPDGLAEAQAGRPLWRRDVLAEPHTPEQRAACATFGTRAWLMVPLVKNGRLVADLTVHSATARAWTAHDIALVQETTERTWAAVERARAEEALRASEEKYRLLFDTIDEGFLLCDVLFNEAGQPYDVLYREANAAALRLAGRDFTGQRLRELDPAYEAYWVELLGQVARTGQPVRAERYAQPHGRWFDFYFFRAGTPGNNYRIATIFQDVTERRQREQNAVLLAEIGKDLSVLTTPDDIMHAVGEQLGIFLGAAACLFADVEEARNEATIHHSWSVGGVASLTQTFQLADYFGEEFRRAGRAGETSIVGDTGHDPHANAAAYAALGIGSFVTVPFQRQGRWVASITVTSRTPRAWRADEIALLQEVAARVFPRIERAHAEAALRASEEKYRTLFETMDEGFVLIDLVENATGQATAYRFVEANQAFGRQTGYVGIIGKLNREVSTADESAWVARYDEVAHTGESQQFEGYHAHTDRWYLGYASRVGGAGSRRVSIVFNDITERKHHEQRQQFLLKFSDTLRAEPDADAVANRALCLLSEHLHLDRCYISKYRLEDDRADITYQTGNDQVPPMPASIRPSDFPEALRVVFDRTLVIDDFAQAEGLSNTDRESIGALGLRALMAATLRKGENQPHWVVVAVSAVPRRWAPGEMALLEEATERTWAAVERARAEAALRTSEEWFRAVANLVPDLLWRTTPGSDTTWYSQRWYEYTGQTPAESAGYGWMDAIHPDDRAESDRRHREALASGQPLHQEHRIRSAAGEYRWFQVQAQPVRNAQGEITAWFGAATDIHARKLAELRQRFLLQLSDALRPLTDPVEVQSAAARVLGEHLGAGRAAYAEIEADDTHFIVHRDYTNGVPSFAGRYPNETFGPRLFAVLHAGRTVVVTDAERETRMGEAERAAYAAGFVRAAVGVPLIKGGRLAGAFFVHFPVPHEATADEVALVEETAERTWAAVERARAEQALAASEQRLRALITNLPGAAAFVVSPDLRYQLAGGEALDASGLTPADLLGHTVAEAMPPELVPQYEAHYRQALAGQGFGLEHTAHGRTFISRGVPLLDAASQPEAVLVVSYDITARKQAEEALLVSETKYRTLFETMDQGFGIGQVLPADEAAGQPLDWQWLEVNPQFERLTGLPRADVLSQTTRRLIPGLEEIWYERYAQAATGETVNFEAYLPVLDRWFDVYAFGIGPASNRRVAVLFSNTSEQKQMEAALREAEARYREQLEQQVLERTQQLQANRDLLQSVLDTSLISMSVLYAVRDEAGQVQDFRLALVNKELERETGRTDLVGKRYAREYPGIRQVGLFELMLRALATGEPQGMEYFYDYDGFSRWYACQFVRLGDGLVATNLDITERKTAEQERLRNLRLLEQAEAVAGLGSWDYDLATGVMRWSEGMYHLVDLPLGQPVSPAVYLELVADDDRPRAEQLVHQLTSGQSVEETLRLRVHEHLKTVRLKAVVLRDEAGQPARVLGVDFDISELQRLEQENLRLRLDQQHALFEAVQEAQEVERKRIAEGLHNGIGQILYATKLQLDRLPAAPNNSPHHRAADLLSEAIRQTRALSHELTPAILEEFGLEATLRSMCNTLSTPALRWHCHLVVDDSPALPPSLQLAVYRLAQELVQNVLKHAHATAATLEVEVLPAWVVLRVEDNGRGFDPAQTSDGLGLRTLRSRAALLGGSVQLATAPGRGTQCQVRLPLPLPTTF